MNPGFANNVHVATNILRKLPISLPAERDYMLSLEVSEFRKMRPAGREAHRRELLYVRRPPEDPIGHKIHDAEERS